MHLKLDTHIAHKLLLIRKHILIIFAYLNLRVSKCMNITNTLISLVHYSIKLQVSRGCYAYGMLYAGKTKCNDSTCFSLKVNFVCCSLATLSVKMNIVQEYPFNIWKLLNIEFLFDKNCD